MVLKRQKTNKAQSVVKSAANNPSVKKYNVKKARSRMVTNSMTGKKPIKKYNVKKARSRMVTNSMTGKKPIKKYNVKKDKPTDTAGKQRPSSMLPLNLDFYNIVDNVYGSYWVGKLINSLQREGLKKIAARHVYKGFTAVKFESKLSPLVIFLEILDKIKPNFRLRTYVVRRTTTKEYPVVVARPRQIVVGLHWLKEGIRNRSGNIAPGFSTEIANQLLEFKLNPKKNNLVKRRNEFMKRTIKGQFNTRYNFKKG